MSPHLTYSPATPASRCPYRLHDSHGKEIDPCNEFLDALLLRNLSPRSLRSYAYDLLNFARWWWGPTAPPLSQIDETALADYVRFQLDQQPRPCAQTINHRLTVVRALLRFHLGTVGVTSTPWQRTVTTYPPMGIGRRRRQLATTLRLRQQRRVMVPLSTEQVAQFWGSFRTVRDLALVGLMLFNGLRSHEVLGLQLEDVRLGDAQLLVRGKGNKQRLLPLAPENIRLLEYYLRLQRPLSNSAKMFVCLKGPHRGQPLTPAGLRSLFRHHRRLSQVPQANPHRFRHTFGRDMVRAGLSLPALMQLMGHAQIRTTMLYVELSPQEVWQQFAQAVARLTTPTVPTEVS
jgi:site-specific recombinase XerD